MSAPANDLHEPAAPAPPPARSAWAQLKPFYWSVRRELWEGRAIYMAPVGVAAVVLAGFLVSLFRLPASVRAFAEGTAKGDHLHMAAVIAALSVIMVSLLVNALYCAGALHGERRDRSILFWKSLPVSDLDTVLAKFAVPMLVMPAVAFAVIFTTQLVIFVLSVLVVLASGQDMGVYLREADPTLMWAAILFGLPTIAWWWAPVWAWLLLVSAWARRMPILWAAAPALAVLIFDRLAFNTRVLWPWLDERLTGGGAHAFSIDGKGEKEISKFEHLEPWRVLSDLDLWTGFLLAAVFLAGAVWLRRRQGPNG